MRLKLVDSEVLVKDFYEHAKKVKSDEEALRLREQEISRKENALEKESEDHLKNQKLTQEKIWEIRDPNAIF
jgi:hypothetical protein